MRKKTTSLNSLAPTLALIGCGAVAESFFMPAIVNKPSLLGNLILVDKNNQRAQELAEKFKVKNVVSNYQTIIGKVDGVIIATPHNLHYPISMDFLSSGAHVLCEKPMAVSAYEARSMVEQADKAGVVLAVNNTRRLIPSNIRIKELISEGVIGDLESIQYYEGAEFTWPTASGFYFSSEGSNNKGVLLDRGAHVLDLFCWWLAGRPELLSFKSDSFGGPEAVAHVMLKNNSCVCDMKLSWLIKQANIYRIKGTKYTIEDSIYNINSLTLISKTGKREKINVRSNVKDFYDLGRILIDNFIDVISIGEKPMISGKDVLDSIILIEECYSNVSRFEMPWYKTQEADSEK